MEKTVQPSGATSIFTFSKSSIESLAKVGVPVKTFIDKNIFPSHSLDLFERLKNLFQFLDIQIEKRCLKCVEIKVKLHLSVSATLFL